MATMTCTEPDCERPARGRGLCGTHYAYRKRHNILPPKFRQDTSRQCAAADCDQPVGLKGARGLCSKHYQRLTKSEWGLEQPPRTAAFEIRFWSKVDKTTSPDGCWLWTAGTAPRTGYGHISIANRTRLAHRVAYQLLVGPIPDGLHLDHVYERGCRNRHCVNPAHLEAVTPAVNNQRISVSPIVSQRRSAAGKKGAAIRWGQRSSS